MSDHLDFELVPEMLSAYLDGELTAPSATRSRRAWPSRRSGGPSSTTCVPRATRSRALPAREAPGRFWDSLLANVAAERRSPRATRRPWCRSESRRPRRRKAWIAAAAAIVVGLVAVIAVPHRSEVRPNVTAVVAAARCAGIRRR